MEPGAAAPIPPRRRRVPRRWPGLRRPRLTIRLRLTLTYGSLFLLGGAVLIVAMTGLVRSSLFARVSSTAVTTPADRAAADLESTAANSYDRAVLDHLERTYPGLKAQLLRLLAHRPTGSTGVVEDQIRSQLRASVTRHLLEQSTILLAVVVLLSLVAGWLVAGRVVARLQRITDAARRASETTLHERLDLPGPPDELKELGDTFDAMLARLDAAFDAQRRFVANASHELRTPLTVTRTAVEVTLAKPDVTTAQLTEMARVVRRATGRAEQLIGGLLTLARSEQLLRRVEDDDLADVAAEALDAVGREVDRRHLTISATLARAPFRGDVALVSTAVANLVENAVRHNVDGGTVHISSGVLAAPADAGDGVDGAGSWLEVGNSGPDIDSAELEQLFEPFHRGDQSRLHDEGAGLGLSIVRAVAATHRGAVRAQVRPGGGLLVRLALPSPGGSTAGSAVPSTGAEPAPAGERGRMASGRPG